MIMIMVPNVLCTLTVIVLRVTLFAFKEYNADLYIIKSPAKDIKTSPPRKRITN